jgi:RND family efflux transporter MFP subunit
MVKTVFMKRKSQTASVSNPRLWLAAIAFLLIAPPVWAGSGTVVAGARTVTLSLQGFARVEAVTLLRLKAAQEGTVAGFKVLPGETLRAGAIVGHLVGPAPRAMLTERQGEVTAAEASLKKARRTLALERENLKAHLGTREGVYRAEAAQAEAKTSLDTARSRLRTARALLTLRAPTAGRVLSVAAGAGERVESGQTLLTLQPADGLWLTATFFGTEAAKVRIGMTGRFTLADGETAVPVRVRTLIGTTTPGGGRTVGLEAIPPSPDWRSGETGTVTLPAGRRTLVAVPTRALILDRGRWWVLVHTPGGNRPQKVVPGPSRGDATLIEKGLTPGTKIVVENAYLEFHRDFSRRFQPPD